MPVSMIPLDSASQMLDRFTNYLFGVFPKLAFELNFDEQTGVLLVAPPFLLASW